MTSCKYMYEQFIKTCCSYSYVGRPSMLYTIADTSHGQVNRMSSLGWTGSTLSNQLGTANPRQVGLTNHGWLPAGATGGPISSQTSSSNEGIIGKSGSNLCRSVRVIVQGCNNRDKGINRPICFSTFSGREKGWGAETSDQPEGVESICEGRAFQRSIVEFLT